MTAQDPFQFDEQLDQFAATIREWFPAWQRELNQFREALAGLQESPTSYTAWKSAAEAVRVAGMSEPPARMRGTHRVPPGVAATFQTRASFACLSLLAAVVDGDEGFAVKHFDRVSKLAQADALGFKHAAEAVAFELVSRWLSINIRTYHGRAKQLAEAMGLPWHIAVTARIVGDRDEATAVASWLDPWANGIEVLPVTPPTVVQSSALVHEPAPRRGIPRAEAEIWVREYLGRHAKDDPDSITRDGVAKAIGASAGSVSKSPAWIAFDAERKKRRKSAPRAVPLSQEMLASLPAEVEAPDELAELIAEQRQEIDHDGALPVRRHKRRHGSS